MATRKPKAASLAADEGVTAPRIKLGETGFSALRTRSGRIMEEANTQFQMPYLAKVVQEMSYSPAVSIGLNAINVLMNNAPVEIEPVVGEDETDAARREYLKSVLHDMEDSWLSTMQKIGTFKEWGHQVSEMVFRRRKYENGSKWNDGLIGISKLAHRPQSSITKWNFDESGRKLVSVSQSVTNAEHPTRYINSTDENGYLVIPREKFLLFRAGMTSDNPQGQSILKSAYLSFKQLTLLEDHMMRGVSKDTSGIPYAQIDVKYMDANASAGDKAFYTQLQTILDNIADGTAKSIVLPTMVDPETKQDKFKLQLLEQKSGKSYDLPLIIRQLQSNILSVLSADSITMAGDQAGSFSLSDSATNMLALKVADLLRQIADTMNAELVPTLWALNGWSAEKLPKIKFGDSSNESKEEFSKFVQRVFSVGGVELDRGVMNKIRAVGGFDTLPDDMPIDTEHLSTTMAGKASNAGAGMEVGVTGEGTAKKPAGQDKSARNAENAS
jgi:hypothetical protein